MTDVPLAFCDPVSIHEADLIATDRPSTKRVGEVYNLKYNAGQRWYWVRDMAEDEALVFVSWDSESRAGKQRTVRNQDTTSNLNQSSHTLPFVSAMPIPHVKVWR